MRLCVYAGMERPESGVGRWNRGRGRYARNAWARHASYYSHTFHLCQSYHFYFLFLSQFQGPTMKFVSKSVEELE